MSKQYALPSHENHGRAPLTALAFRQVPEAFRCRKGGGQALSAQTAVATDSDDDDLRPNPGAPANKVRKELRDEANISKNKRKAENKEKKGKAENKEKEGKKGKKLNVTEDEAARNGLSKREERAVDNQRTKWGWGKLGPEQRTMPEPESTQPMPEMDEEGTFDTPR